ncbi:hypothetical protein FQN60_018525 [Etheostoma spectabile]|uniref:Uncharacterized protein n=1 Tax=Etheostoma spectabile TaxID=54343 RepID=A0A5J5DIJ9_9PERO|nr:hypothetical protein FQN60_018525 [Etheostoma spectabile]
MKPKRTPFISAVKFSQVSKSSGGGRSQPVSASPRAPRLERPVLLRTHYGSTLGNHAEKGEEKSSRRNSHWLWDAPVSPSPSSRLEVSHHNLDPMFWEHNSLAGPRSFQDKYQTKPSPPRQTQNTTRAAQHPNNYYCSCSSELPSGAKPAALQVTLSAHLRNKKKLGWVAEESGQGQTTETRPEQVWELQYPARCGVSATAVVQTTTSLQAQQLKEEIQHKDSLHMALAAEYKLNSGTLRFSGYVDNLWMIVVPEQRTPLCLAQEKSSHSQ